MWQNYLISSIFANLFHTWGIKVSNNNLMLTLWTLMFMFYTLVPSCSSILFTKYSKVLQWHHFQEVFSSMQFIPPLENSPSLAFHLLRGSYHLHLEYQVLDWGWNLVWKVENQWENLKILTSIFTKEPRGPLRPYQNLGKCKFNRFPLKYFQNNDILNKNIVVVITVWFTNKGVGKGVEVDAQVIWKKKSIIKLN